LKFGELAKHCRSLFVFILFFANLNLIYSLLLVLVFLCVGATCQTLHPTPKVGEPLMTQLNQESSLVKLLKQKELQKKKKKKSEGHLARQFKDWRWRRTSHSPYSS